MRIFFTSVFSFLCVLLFAQSTLILYRPSNNNYDKYKLRIFINYQDNDSLPASNGFVFTQYESESFSVKGRIENYAHWPTTLLNIESISKDTTYVSALVKKDKFGNATIVFKTVSKEIGRSDLASISTITQKSDEDEEESVKDSRLSVNGRKIPHYSGSGFLVSKNGYVITNYHVIERGKEFRVRNVYGNKDSSYTATVIAKDEQNDLAILKISNPNLGLDSIPYAIKNKDVDLGEKIVIFGFPLLDRMGDDIKMTSGIISSVNGYQGEKNAYQLSAPIQPGNSGGPVFDEKGNLIAIANAKLMKAENATYAIKSAYLCQFLEKVKDIETPATEGNLWKLTLTEQAKLLQKFVYIIEVD